jgi:MFS family permease
MSADAAVEEDAGEYETMSADAAEEEDAGEYEAETRGLLDGSAATPGPAAPAPPPPLRSVMLALVPIAYVPGFFQSLYEYVIDPVMPLYAKSLGCNDTEVGIIVAGMLIGSMCFNIPAGVAVSRFGSTPVFVASMVICSIAAGCMLAATGFASLLFAQLFSGLGSSLFNVGVSSLIRNATPAQYRGRVISIKGGLGRMAMMVSSAIGGLVAQRYGLKAPFLLRALLPLLSLLVFVLTNCCGGSSSGHPAASPSPSPKGGGGSGSSSDRSIYDADAPLSTCGVIRLARTELCTAGYVAFSIMGVRNARRIVLPLAATSVGLSVAEIGNSNSNSTFLNVYMRTKKVRLYQD